MAQHDTVRIGIIGAGSIFRDQHLPRLATIDGARVVVVSNRSEASSRKAAEPFDIPEVEADWRKLVARDDLDAVMIGTWPYKHREMSVAALEAGKHVFCQARMATDLAEAQKMVAAAEAHPELVNMICPPPHRMPYEPWVRQVLASGELGELREVHLRCVNGSNLGELTWRERVEYSGKQVMQVGIWAETLHAWVGEYETLTATTATPIATKPGDDGKPCTIRIPQVVLVQGRLRSGVAIQEHHSGVALHERANGLDIYGSKATLRLEVGKPPRLGRAGGELEAVDVPAELQRPWQVERDFIDAVRAARRGTPPEQRRVSPDFQEGLRYMRKIEAIHAAADADKAVSPAAL